MNGPMYVCVGKAITNIINKAFCEKYYLCHKVYS